MRGNRKLIGIWLLAAISLVAATGFTWSLAQPQTTLKVVPQVLNIKVGEKTTVDLWIEGVSELYGAEIHLKFDPSVLEVIDADPDREGVQIEPGTFPIPDFVVQNVADNQAGTIDYASTQLPPNKPGEGDGVVARVTFRAKKPAVSQVQIDQFLLADTEGSNIDAVPQHGQIKVGQSSGRVLAAAVGLALLVTAGGGVGFALAKRK